MSVEANRTKVDTSSEQSIRVRVNVETKNPTEVPPFWYLVNLHGAQCVSDLLGDIRRKLGLADEGLNWQIYLEGYLVPVWESTLLLRENDTIILR